MIIIAIGSEDQSYRPDRPGITPTLYKQLLALRPLMAAAAQNVYNGWTQDKDGADDTLGQGGICDQIAQALQDVISSNLGDVELDEYGHDGDDHAAVVASRGKERYYVDIPYQMYETGSGYRWKKIEDVKFNSNHVLVQRL